MQKYSVFVKTKKNSWKLFAKAKHVYKNFRETKPFKKLNFANIRDPLISASLHFLRKPKHHKKEATNGLLNFIIEWFNHCATGLSNEYTKNTFNLLFCFTKSHQGNRTLQLWKQVMDIVYRLYVQYTCPLFCP
jgi:hypothetical protein